MAQNLQNMLNAVDSPGVWSNPAATSPAPMMQSRPADGSTRRRRRRAYRADSSEDLRRRPESLPKGFVSGSTPTVYPSSFSGQSKPSSTFSSSQSKGLLNYPSSSSASSYPSSSSMSSYPSTQGSARIAFSLSGHDATTGSIRYVGISFDRAGSQGFPAATGSGTPAGFPSSFPGAMPQASGGFPASPMGGAPGLSGLSGTGGMPPAGFPNSLMQAFKTFKRQALTCRQI